MEFKVGDRVKCLDFAGNEKHYKIGTVIEVMNETMKVKTEKEVVSGKDKNYPAVLMGTFVTPLPGVHFMDAHYPGRITHVA